MSVDPAASLMLLAGLAVLGSWWACGAWRRFALRRHVVDVPDPRRLHTAPTPRGGGVGIAMVLLATSPWLGQGALAFSLGLALTAGSGLYDDLRPMRALPKFALQALGALPLALAWPLLPDILGNWGSVGGAWLLVVGLVNAWNFMDGSNGLAATQAGLVGLALAWFSALGSSPSWLGVALAAGCLGFLPYNLPRARLFLGDVGSYALGYTVAAGLLLSLERQQAGVAALVLLPSAFVIDAGCTLAMRAWRRQKVWLAHREHLYQRAVSHGWSHSGICAAYAVWTLAAIGLARWLQGGSPPLQLAVLAIVSGLGFALYLWTARLWPHPEPGTATEPVR